MGFFKADPPEKVARAAWDSGARYFTPTIVASSGFNTGGVGTRSVADWSAAIAAIDDVGWELHTWHTVVLKSWLGATSDGFVAAQPLFVRPRP